MSNETTTTLLATKFCAELRQLSAKMRTVCITEEDDALIDHFQRKANFIEGTVGPSALFLEACPYFAQCAEKILERDEKFFTGNIDKILPLENAPNAVRSLVQCIERAWNITSLDVKEALFVHVLAMLELCLEHSAS